jgi:hypothetical protein
LRAICKFVLLCISATMTKCQITSLFQCPNIPTATAPGAPTPTLAHFVAYALHRTRLPSIVTFAALLLLQRLKVKFPAARGSSGHRLFISAFMISSKVICDDTYSNQSWGIVAQKMFALKEINQMEREMCGYLEWNLNVGGEEVIAFEQSVRGEFGPRAVSRSLASEDLPMMASKPSNAYPTPDTTPDVANSRPIRPVPTPFKHRSSYTQQPITTTAAGLPSPPASPHYSHSPQPPHFSSNTSSLQSSPASDDCKTPSPVAVGPSSHARIPNKGIHESSMGRYEPAGARRSHASQINTSSYPVHVGGW